jgi:hypothetical protein
MLLPASICLLACACMLSCLPDCAFLSDCPPACLCLPAYPYLSLCLYLLACLPHLVCVCLLASAYPPLVSCSLPLWLAVAASPPAPRIHMNGATGRSASGGGGARGRVVKPTTPPQPIPTPKPAAAPTQGKATTSRKRVQATQPAVAAPQQAPTKKQLPFHLPTSLQSRITLICWTTYL